MSDRMTGMSFDQLMNWVTEELENHGTLFGLHRAYKAPEETLTIFGRDLETPIGPAAGPNSQLAQNIAASYYAGSRFFELKTVQIMDGDELAACVNKPCIKADDEAYNCEWSTELSLYPFRFRFHWRISSQVQGRRVLFLHQQVLLSH